MKKLCAVAFISILGGQLFAQQNYSGFPYIRFSIEGDSIWYDNYGVGFRESFSPLRSSIGEKYENSNRVLNVIFGEDCVFVYENEKFLFYGNREARDGRSSGPYYYPFERVITSGYLSETIRGVEVSYNPELLLDYDIQSVWAVSNDSSGIGESLTLYTSRGEVDKILIVNGFIDFSHPSLYSENARVKLIEISIDSEEDGLIFELEDTASPQIIYLGSVTNQIVIKILDVYPGTKYRDLAIAGIFAGTSQFPPRGVFSNN